MASAYREAGSSLGALVRVHEGRADGCFAVVAGAGFLVACAGLEALAVVTGSIVQAIVWIAVGVAGVWFGRRWLARQKPDVVERYEEGLLQRQRGASVTIRFDDVVSIRSDRVKHQSGTGPVTERHTIEATDGARITFTLMHDLAQDLLANIEERVIPRLQQAALRAFDAGEIVRFGRFAVSEEGLHLPAVEGSKLFDTEPRPARVVPWSELRDPQVKDAFLHFAGEIGSQIGGLFINDTPNATIFLTMTKLAIEQEQAAADEAE